MNRRRMLGLTAGSIVGATAIGAFSGSALAWTDRRIEFKGCSEIWVVTTESDLKDGSNPSVSKPPVAMVVVGLDDGSVECRELLATHQNATTVPGQYGDLAVLKYAVSGDEKILGVITYNRLPREPWENRFDDPSCWAINEHTCATTPGTESFFEADCVQDAIEDGVYECPADTVTGSWERGGGSDRGAGSNRGSRGRGR